MNRLILFLAGVLLFNSCDSFFDTNSKHDEENENTVYCITEEIGSFESVFVSSSGQIVATEVDENDNCIVYMDNVDISKETAIVAYVNKNGKIDKLYLNGEIISISYDENNVADIFFTNEEGKLDKIKNVSLSSSLSPYTKAGNVLDPYDLFSVATIGKDAVDIVKKLLTNKKFNTKTTLGSIALLEQIAALKFGNTLTAVGLGIIAIATASSGLVTVAAILAIIDVANAAINDWQDHIADIYYGGATPITGDALQISPRHFLISYEIENIPDSAKFNVGVIIADGLFITKNYNLMKETESYPSKNGHIIIDLYEIVENHKWDKENLENLIKFGKEFKYRVFIEPKFTIGYKLDDIFLDYWRYGEVRKFVIEKLPINISSIEYTNTNRTNDYTIMGARCQLSNEIPYEYEDYGVFLVESESEIQSDYLFDYDKFDKDKYDSASISNDALDLHVTLSDDKMKLGLTPYEPIKNYYAVPYVKVNDTYCSIYENAVKVNYTYEKERPTPGKWVDMGLSVKWAGWNIGASKPEGFGGYYSWGETEGKSSYTYSNYKYAERYIDSDGTTRYRDIFIGNNISGTSYDVARVKWGDKARIPTESEFCELAYYCTNIYAFYNGVPGLFIVGHSGNSIFLPFAYINNDMSYYVELGYYRTGTTDTRGVPRYAYMYFDNNYYNKYIKFKEGRRVDGLSVRAVSDY